MDMFTVNDRNYHLPEQPVVVICVDGCEEAYLDVALAQDRMPSLARILEEGWRSVARGALPSFTNVKTFSLPW
jgi:phosphonoacetate hydrolase